MNHLRVGRHREYYTFYLNGCVIEQINGMYDIGVFVQSDLKFNTHCNSLAKRAHFCIRNIFNIFIGHDGDFYISLYCTYVRPILEYATPAWSSYLKGDIDHVESVQCYITRRLFDRYGLG